MKKSFTPRPIKIPTAESLSNIALHYLSRFAASEASLRKVLQNRLRRVALKSPVFAADNDKQKCLNDAIETIIARYIRSGVLNDAAYAETKINSLRRAGRSNRAITQKLSLKGIEPSTISYAFTQHDEGAHPEDQDLKAAILLARRRKLGPYRLVPDPEKIKKDMATMARAGFSFSTIKKVLNTALDDDDISFE